MRLSFSHFSVLMAFITPLLLGEVVQEIYIGDLPQGSHVEVLGEQEKIFHDARVAAIRQWQKAMSAKCQEDGGAGYDKKIAEMKERITQRAATRYQTKNPGYADQLRDSIPAEEAQMEKNRPDINKCVSRANRTAKGAIDYEDFASNERLKLLANAKSDYEREMLERKLTYDRQVLALREKYGDKPFTLPKFELPKFVLPRFKSPEFMLPKFKLHQFVLRQFHIEKQTFHKFETPKTQFHKFVLPKYTLRAQRLHLPSFNLTDRANEVKDGYDNGVN